MLLKVLYFLMSIFVVSSVARHVAFEQDKNYGKENPIKDWIPLDFRFGANEAVRCKVYVPQDLHGALKRTWDTVTEDETSKTSLQSSIRSKLGGLWRSFWSDT